MKIVFPVRFAARHGAAVQTTSGEMTGSRMLLMCSGRRPPSAAPVALQLYLPDSFPPGAAMGRVDAAAGKNEGFWVDLVDAVRGVAARIEALLSLYAPRLNRCRPDGAGSSPHRAAPRYPTSLPVIIGAGPKLIYASARNISASGLYVQTDAEVPVGSVVGVRLALADGGSPLGVQARVIHRVTGGQAPSPWVEPGIGLQFVEGDDAFRARLDRQLERLNARRKR
jgi:Tfp pilus assembly protein PilZ